MLKKIFYNVEGTAGHNTDDYNFFKDLYEFNKTYRLVSVIVYSIAIFYDKEDVSL